MFTNAAAAERFVEAALRAASCWIRSQQSYGVGWRHRFLRMKVNCIIGLGFLSMLAACETRDPCLDAHRQLLPSPSGTRQIDIFSGPCPNAAPQILIMFNHGAGGSGVFAVNDSAIVARARWIGEDTVEITYPRQARVLQQRSFAQNGSQRVTVTYVVLTDSVARADSVHPKPSDSVVFLRTDTLPSIDPLRGSIDGVMLDMSRGDVRRLWKKPARVERLVYDEYLDDWTQVWDYPGKTVEFYGPRVEDVRCIGPSCSTKDGVKVGEAEARVVSIYGQPGRGAPEDQRILRYLLGKSDCWIDFHVLQGRVTEIRLMCDYS